MSLKKYLCTDVIGIIRKFENCWKINHSVVFEQLIQCVDEYSECDCVKSTYEHPPGWMHHTFYTMWYCNMCGCLSPKKIWYNKNHPSMNTTVRIYSYFEKIQSIKDKKIREFIKLHEYISLMENHCEQLNIDLLTSEEKLKGAKKKYKINYNKVFKQCDYYKPPDLNITIESY